MASHSVRAVRQRCGGWWLRVSGTNMFWQWRGRIRVAPGTYMTAALVTDRVGGLAPYVKGPN